jgi:hypothetical protein
MAQDYGRYKDLSGKYKDRIERCGENGAKVE